LTGKNMDIHDPEVTAEYLSIKTTIYQERKDRLPVMDVLMFRDKTQNFRRLLLSCGTQFMQQFSGVNALGTEPVTRWPLFITTDIFKVTTCQLCSSKV